MNRRRAQECLTIKRSSENVFRSLTSVSGVGWSRSGCGRSNGRRSASEFSKTGPTARLLVAPKIPRDRRYLQMWRSSAFASQSARSNGTQWGWNGNTNDVGIMTSARGLTQKCFPRSDDAHLRLVLPLPCCNRLDRSACRLLFTSVILATCLGRPPPS